MTLYTPISSGVDDVKKLIDDALLKDQETLVLASLPAGVWTNFPASTANPGRAIAGFSVFDSNGNDITASIEIRENAGVWQISSLVALINIQLKLEY